MIRSALVIYCDKSKYGDLPGAAVDARSWKKYLTSTWGGAWHDKEITLLQSPGRSELERQLAGMKAADIAVVTFSGHGFHKRGRGIDESFVCINDLQEVSVSSLNVGADRTLVVADSCRGIVAVEKSALEARLSRGWVYFPRDKFRQDYEDAFLKAERGAIYMYSCDIDEAAGESDTHGGDFSSSLIKSGFDWATDRQTYPIVNQAARSLSTKAAFERASKLVDEKNPQQNPQYQAGRRMRHFPFAVR